MPIFLENKRETNTDYLIFSGVSDDIGFNKVLYGLAGVLIALIMFGSISLIYNAFSISVSERTKQFGLFIIYRCNQEAVIKKCVF